MKRFSLLMTMLLAGAIALWATPVKAADEHGTAAHGSTPAETTGGHDAAAGHGDAHNTEAGLPPTTQEGVVTAITTLIVFLVLVVVLGKFAWGPISKGLQEREEKIRADIRNAEEARARSEATLKQYQAQLATAEAQVRDLLNKAQQDAEKISTNVKMKAQQDAEEIKERANRDIDAARAAAVRDVYEQAANLSTNIAEKIIKRNLNAQDQQDLVNAGIEEFQAVAAK